MAQSHRLYDHAARSLRTERDTTAVSKRHDAAWAKATTVQMPPELGGLASLRQLLTAPRPRLMWTHALRPMIVKKTGGAADVYRR